MVAIEDVRINDRLLSTFGTELTYTHTVIAYHGTAAMTTSLVLKVLPGVLRTQAQCDSRSVNCLETFQQSPVRVFDVNAHSEMIMSLEGRAERELGCEHLCRLSATLHAQ